MIISKERKRIEYVKKNGKRMDTCSNKRTGVW